MYNLAYTTIKKMPSTSIVLKKEINLHPIHPVHAHVVSKHIRNLENIRRGGRARLNKRNGVSNLSMNPQYYQALGMSKLTHGIVNEEGCIAQQVISASTGKVPLTVKSQARKVAQIPRCRK